MVLEKGREDRLERSCEKISITKSKCRKERATYSKLKEGNRIGKFLCRSCLIKHLIEGKMGRRGGGLKQLMKDFKETGDNGIGETKH